MGRLSVSSGLSFRSGLSRSNGLSVGGGLSSIYDLSTLEWKNAVVANGGSVSDARLLIVSNFVNAEKQAGTWALTDDYYLLWGENSVQARTSLKRRMLAVEVNSPSFQASRGYTGDGLSSYINTGYVASTMAVAMTDGNGRMSAYVLTDVNTPSVLGAAAGFRLNPKGATNTPGAAVMATLFAFPDVLPTSVGYISAQRSGTTTMSGHKNGVALTDTVVTGGTTMPSTSMFLLARNNSGAPANFYTGQTGFVSWGAPMTLGQNQAQYANVLAMAQSIGAA